MRQKTISRSLTFRNLSLQAVKKPFSYCESCGLDFPSKITKKARIGSEQLLCRRCTKVRKKHCFFVCSMKSLDAFNVHCFLFISSIDYVLHFMFRLVI